MLAAHSDMPRIRYFGFQQTLKRYYPDMYIPKYKLFIEIKSSWTYRVNEFINIRKKQGCQYLGYDHQIWIMNQNGSIEEII